MRRNPFDRLGRLGVVALTALALIATAGAAVAKEPYGNNGTVKVHDGATDTEPIVHNEPHVTTFHLHFFFADPTQSGWWKIRAWAPGDKGALVLDGTYDTAPDGSDRQPVNGAFSLPSGHYKLFWEGRNEHNIKHKTFWVEYAEVAPTQSVQPTEEAPPTGSPTPTGSVAALTSGPTLPPTNTTQQPTSTGSANLGAVFAFLAMIVALGLLLAPARPRRHR